MTRIAVVMILSLLMSSCIRHDALIVSGTYVDPARITQKDTLKESMQSQREFLVTVQRRWVGDINSLVLTVEQDTATGKIRKEYAIRNRNLHEVVYDGAQIRVMEDRVAGVAPNNAYLRITGLSPSEDRELVLAANSEKFNVWKQHMERLRYLESYMTLKDAYSFRYHIVNETGTWTGMIAIRKADAKAGSWEGTYKSNEHGTTVDLEEVRFDGESIQFLRPHVNQRFAGTLSGNSVQGTFTWANTKYAWNATLDADQ